MPRPGSTVLHPRMLGTAADWSARGQVDTCTITRTAGSTWDPETNADTPTTDTVYEGTIRLQDVQPFGGGRVVGFGDEPVTTSSYFAVIHDTAADVRVEDVVTIDTSADPALVGRTLRVTESLVDSFHVHRRLVLEDATTPEGD